MSLTVTQYTNSKSSQLYEESGYVLAEAAAQVQFPKNMLPVRMHCLILKSREKKSQQSSSSSSSSTTTTATTSTTSTSTIVNDTTTTTTDQITTTTTETTINDAMNE